MSPWPKGRPRSKEEKERLSRKNRGNHYRKGGTTGDAFAQVLCTVGYIREHCVVWGPDGKRNKFWLDFAHPEAKVDIELDGPWHLSLGDAERDRILRTLGWKVIRIKHD